jgi:tripeptide aminopeptidase
MNLRQKALSEPYFPEAIVSRFLRYVRIDTTSDRKADAIPSTPRQWELIRLLESELRSIGKVDVEVKEHGYVIGRVEASPGLESLPRIGLMAHVDTSSDVSGEGVSPIVHRNYDGGDLSIGNGVVLSPLDCPDLLDREGDTIISSDGRTLLGADDKAGVAIVMASLPGIVEGRFGPHGPLAVVFTPDEETGKGLDAFDPGWLGCRACYTFDGGKLGEMEYECFNAYEATAAFTGSVIHLGSARGKLANAAAMAADFAAGLPRSESPEATDGWYGYYCPLEIKGDLARAEVSVFLRDYRDEGMERRISALKAMSAATEARFPGGKAELTFKEQYRNMRGKLEEVPEVMRRLEDAARAAGVEPCSKPIRGGTDGSRLTEMGVPTPNVFTGSYCFHSVKEWCSLSEMTLSAHTLVNLVRAWAERG